MLHYRYRIGNLVGANENAGQNLPGAFPIALAIAT
ncbi:hypothetical protein EDF59_10466 [Novosphingobium sp. ST904]|nr:hypothetical protein EDF59_10466 [Novosphingobium sp. ST904]